MSNSASYSRGRFPSYKKPPVNEVVCGIRFQPSPNLTLPHVGLLWNKFREEYPRVQHATPIALSADQLLVDPATGVPLPRVWFMNQQDNQLVQFQMDRLYFNWRQRGDVYPRYENVIQNFEGALDTLEAFFKEFALGELSLVECELSYINHIQREEGRDTLDDVQSVFRDVLWQESPRFLPNPTVINWELRFPLPDKKGRLNAKLSTATRAADNIPIFVLDLTARGIGQSTDRKSIREWFDTAHEWIVCGFADLTTEEVQRNVWERENA
jgi:uncharacterized protein (TIGR04255 family)